MSKGYFIISGESRLFREGLKHILVSSTLSQAGQVSSLVELPSLLRSMETACNLIICDPGADSVREFQAMREISTDFPSIALIVLTNDVSQAAMSAAVASGANGYLSNDVSPAALQTLIELVLLGEKIFAGPWASIQVITTTRESPTTPEELRFPLSPKESEILSCLENGLPNKVIARNLNMAEATVKVHLKALLRKINVENRTQAAVWSLNRRDHANFVQS